QLVNEAPRLQPGMAVLDLGDDAADKRNRANVGQGEEAGPEAVVDVMGVVGDVVGERRSLRLQTGVEGEVERLAPVAVQNRLRDAARAIARRGPPRGVDERAVVLG